ncbi:MAG TPA: aspartate--ammonia ligase [Candidatus Ornithoclostridium excrementipullorum]|nr:aspartate--ammonia ligase [Candidatus Ornithoclostridium excrementipullorum]
MMTPLLETEIKIKFIKDNFERLLARNLDLTRVSAPLFVPRDSGLNDNLNGVERPVDFDIKQTGVIAEVVHSLAKWKRFALYEYGFEPGKGLYTDMNAIRRDEICDELHSIYVDQWDWEKVITRQQRNADYLRATVKSIYDALKECSELLSEYYGERGCELPSEVTFVTTQELEDRYPDLAPSERETAFVKECGAMFLTQIGGRLKSGKKHDGRAPDYDDWALNGDLVLYYPVLDRAFELSSMGIRVDRDSLIKQLETENATDRLSLPFHKALADGTLPLTIGGGIGQSRLCMLLLGKRHIGEVQASIWPDDMRRECESKGIRLL